MTNDLKPCPFCGYKDVHLGHVWQIFSVSCSHCRIEGPVDPTEAGAIAAWNARAPESLPDSIQEALNSGDGVYRP
jgi:Lar family restriction alleviation protein